MKHRPVVAIMIVDSATREKPLREAVLIQSCVLAKIQLGIKLIRFGLFIKGCNIKKRNDCEDQAQVNAKQRKIKIKIWLSISNFEQTPNANLPS